MQAPMEPLPPEGSSGGGFLGTPRGRIVAIAGAVLALAVVVGLAVYFLAPGLFGKEEGVKPSANAAKAPAGATPGSAVNAVAAGEEVTEPENVALSDIFTFRDIFDPLFPEVVEDETPGATPGATPGTTPTSTPDVSENTLYLEDIVVLDGIPYAYLIWNGDEYVLREGEGIPGTPWQVLSISENSVVMLFGDVQVTLTIGQGVTK